MDSRPYVFNVLFCDDVRTEASGKEIAIGIFPGYIYLQSFPALMPLIAIRFELMFYDQPIQDFSIRIVDPNGNILVDQTKPLDFAHWDLPGSATFAFQGLIVATPGNYGVFTKTTGRDWELQRNLHFGKMDRAEGLRRWEVQVTKSKEVAARSTDQVNA